MAVEVGEFEAGDGGGDGAEVVAEEGGAEADGLEDAGVAVGAEGGDAHLGHGFHEAAAEGGDRICRGAVGGVGGEGGDGGEGEPGADGGGAEAEEDGQVVDFADFAGVDDEADGGTEAGVG